MKGILKTTLFGAALAVAGAGFAQSSTSPQKGDEDRTPVSSPSATQSSSTDTSSTGSMSPTAGTTATRTETFSSSTSTSVTTPGTYAGTVKTIDTGHTLVITTADGKTQTFDISSSPAFGASVAVGSRVQVKQTVDASGKTVVSVEPYR